MIEERNDARNRFGTAKSVQHAQQQRDDFVFFRVVQRLQNRLNRLRAEIDECLRRDFRAIGFLQAGEQRR